MANASHTPMPWHVRTREWPEGHVIPDTFLTHNSPTRRWETHLGSDTGSPGHSIGATQEEAEANAHVMAAALDLLEALKEARERMVGSSPAIRALIAKTDAAIAKAEGR